MSVIEECATAVKQAGFYGSILTAENAVKTVLKTLAGKLDQRALDEARWELHKSTVRGDKLENAIQCYLNQLINEEKE